MRDSHCIVQTCTIDKTSSRNQDTGNFRLQSQHVKSNSLPRILLTNVNRLCNKVDELYCLVKDEQLDIVCITETWLTSDDPDSLSNFSNYLIFRRDMHDKIVG